MRNYLLGLSAVLLLGLGFWGYRTYVYERDVDNGIPLLQKQSSYDIEDLEGLYDTSEKAQGYRDELEEEISSEWLSYGMYVDVVDDNVFDESIEIGMVFDYEYKDIVELLKHVDILNGRILNHIDESDAFNDIEFANISINWYWGERYHDEYWGYFKDDSSVLDLYTGSEFTSTHFVLIGGRIDRHTERITTVVHPTIYNMIEDSELDFLKAHVLADDVWDQIIDQVSREDYIEEHREMLDDESEGSNDNEDVDKTEYNKFYTDELLKEQGNYDKSEEELRLDREEELKYQEEHEDKLNEKIEEVLESR